ncbi:MAG: TSUP family transporter [Nitrospiraceae bacterium]|nr:TSUP family transporter [Nitrospiraceae bacterium]
MEQLALLAVVFFGVSTVFSLIGMGGGILYVPILLFAGFSIKEAPSISLILILATSLSALFTFWKNKKVDWKLAAVIDPPTDIMAFVGGYFSAMVPGVYLKGLLAVVLMIAGTLMLLRQDPSRARTPAATRWWVWRRHFDGNDYSVNLPVVLTATALIGVLSGMLGITGGIIKLPIMVLLCGVPMDIAVATSTVMVAVTALSGLIGHTAGGTVDWRVGLVLAVGAVVGGVLGSRISLKTNKAILKRLFGVAVWAIALRLLVGLMA